jgi:predicted RNA-binding Zn ribbon-like protein
VHFNHYGGSAAQLSTALVNFCHQHGAGDPGGLRALLVAHNVDTGTLTAAQAEQLCAWADSLRQAYGETSLDRQVETINTLLEEGASRPFVSRHGGRVPHLHYFPEDPDVVTRVRAQTAAGLAHVLCDAGGQRLGRCDRDECGLVFLDTSRGGRRRFCSLRCANRVRVADHRHRAARRQTR